MRDERGDVELVVDSVTADGDGVGRLANGQVVFVSRTFPGDVVRVRLRGTRRHVQHGDVVALLRPSEARRESRCSVERCGGCAFKDFSIGAQRQVKRARAVETMRRIGGIDLDDLLGPIRAFGDGWGYRHRTRLHAAWSDGGWILGYQQRRSHRTVSLATCPVLWPDLEGVCQQLGRALATLPRSAQLLEVEVAYARRDGAAARLVTKGLLRVLRADRRWLAASGLSGIEVCGADGTWRHGSLRMRYDHGAADAFNLLFEPGVFTQAFPEANDALVAAVLQASEARAAPRILELHAGIGNFSVPLARAGATVVATERDKRAAGLCRQNAAGSGVRVDVSALSDVAALAGEALEAGGGVDVLVMDPPRLGARSVVEKLVQIDAAPSGVRGSLLPERIVYVSCDVGTLARDASILCAGPYDLVSAHAFDLFPETPHVEILAVFTRRRGRNQ